MRQLPSAGCGEDEELDQSPTDDTGIGGFGLIAEFRFPFLEEVYPSQFHRRFTFFLHGKKEQINKV